MLYCNWFSFYKKRWLSSINVVVNDIRIMSELGEIMLIFRFFNLLVI